MRLGNVEVRALAFVQGDMTFVLAYVDCVRLFAGNMDLIRQHPVLAGLSIDHITIGSTHAHDAPDTAGIWGPTIGSTGRQPFVIEVLHERAAEAIKEAVERAEPAQLVVASTKTLNDHNNLMSRTDDWFKDIRDPIIFDPTLTIARFVKASAPTETIGTLVHWADHPEVAHFDETHAIASSRNVVAMGSDAALSDG